MRERTSEGRWARWTAVAALPAMLLYTGAAAAVEAPQPELFGRYMPLYPGMYATGSLAYDPRDSSFDQSGDEHRTVTPNLSGRSEFPEERATLAFQWYFPMFETEGLPFFSSRLHTARLTLRAASPDSKGRLDNFAKANGLDEPGSGIGDLTLDFGSFLIGSGNWRERQRSPLAVLALVGVTLPTGTYKVDAPANTGSNENALHILIGAHYQPTSNWYVDGGLTWKTFDRNQEPQFGANAPAQLGDLLLADLSLGRRLMPGLYFTGFVQYQDGDANRYHNPRFAVDSPTPPPLMENHPTPGDYKDKGTQLLTAGASLQYFFTQNLVGGLHLAFPLDGKSGEFTLPFDNQNAGCQLANNCMPTPSGQSVVVDGLGGARSYASDMIMLTLGYSFGRGDPWQ